MLVAICDDEAFFREELKSILFAYKAERRLHIDVYQYPSGEALISDKKIFDIVFLDQQMPGLNGMQVARTLRNRNITCSIVFVTGYPDFVYESFEVQPYRFLRKPVKTDEIADLMNTFIKHQKLLSPITVINNGEQTVIHAKDILYLEGDGKYCTIRTNTAVYHSSKTLAQVYEQLPQHCFYRSHKSYVVNLYCIDSFDRESATLTNGELTKIGRNKAAEFKLAYRQFVKDFYVKV